LKRLPLIWTSTSSPGRPRSDGARTKVDASEIVFWPTKKDGTMFLTVSRRFAVGWVVISCELITSIGEAELVTVRSVRRVPVMTISSELVAATDVVPAPGVGPVAGTGMGWAANAGADRPNVKAVADDRSARR